MKGIVFYDNDKNGFIKNRIEDDHTNIKKLTPFFSSLKKIVQDNSQENLISIFITYEQNKDNSFNIVIIIIDEKSIQTQNFNNNLLDLKNEFKFIKKCNIFFHNKEEATNKELLFSLKLNFICIYGEDFKKDVKAFKPSIEEINFDFEKLALLFSELNENTLNDRNAIVGISKIILGASFLLCIDREKKYSRNKYFYYKTFIKYYPDKEIFAKEFFRTLDHDEKVDKVLFYKLLKYFGKWLILEYSKITIERALINND